MIILLDVDGPLTDGFTEMYLQKLSGVTGRKHTLDEVEEYDLSAMVRRHVTEANRDSVLRFINIELSKPGVAKRFAPCSMAKSAVEVIRRTGAEVWALTAPYPTSPTWTHDRAAWLFEHFAISPRNVIHAIEKHRVSGDFFLDDKPEHVQAWRKVNGGRARIGAWLWGKKYNEASPVKPRTDSWAEVLEAVHHGMKAA